MSTLALVSVFFWSLLLTIAAFSPAAVKINGKPVRNPIARMLTVSIMLGMVAAIGWFLAAPFVELIQN